MDLTPYKYSFPDAPNTIAVQWRGDNFFELMAVCNTLNYAARFPTDEQCRSLGIVEVFSRKGKGRGRFDGIIILEETDWWVYDCDAHVATRCLNNIFQDNARKVEGSMDTTTAPTPDVEGDPLIQQLKALSAEQQCRVAQLVGCHMGMMEKLETHVPAAVVILYRAKLALMMADVSGAKANPTATAAE